jgi:GH43 family beta-xylosidase
MPVAGHAVGPGEAHAEEEIVGDPLYNPNRHAFLMQVEWDVENRPVFSYDNMNIVSG